MQNLKVLQLYKVCKYFLFFRIHHIYLILLALDSVVEPLRITLEKKPKDSAVKQDKERYDELARSALRAIIAISQIPGADTSTKFTDFMNSTVLVGEIREKYQALKESSSITDPMDIN